MCNIAAYLGDRRAAPILIDMLRRQEGYDAGFSTGIATIADGQLHTRKVEGDLDQLLAETDASDLPGNIGMIHGRTPGHGGAAWAHPFLASDESFALILNGTAGIFADAGKSSRIAQSLERDGFPFRTAFLDHTHNGPRLSDGSLVHRSEVCTLLTEKHIRACGDIALGMQYSDEEHPGEVVSLLLHRNHCDRIFVSRISMPMMLARNVADEVFLASFSGAFPVDRDITSIAALQPKTVNTVFRDRLETRYHRITTPIINNLPWHDAETEIIRALGTQGAMSMGNLRSQLDSIWPAGVIPQKNFLLYHLLPDMQRRGLIVTKNVRIPGNHPPLTAPSVSISLAQR